MLHDLVTVNMGELHPVIHFEELCKALVHLGMARWNPVRNPGQVTGWMLLTPNGSSDLLGTGDTLSPDLGCSHIPVYRCKNSSKSCHSIPEQIKFHFF